jgi:hypothetical protein
MWAQEQQEHRGEMRSTIFTYTRMIIELLVALFLIGLFAALTGGAAYGISQLAHF